MDSKQPKISKYEQQYGPIADEMAKKYGIDPALFRNQIRQESGFNPAARSGAGALGIAQFMPYHAGKYGTTTANDFMDPNKALSAAAQHMAALTKQYGDQKLALVAYNGGGGAIDFVRQKLGKKNITADEWKNYMTKRRSEVGNSPTAWHGQTLDYLNRITSGVNPITKPQHNMVKNAPAQPTPAPVMSIPQAAPTKFDYHEELSKTRQANPAVEQVQQPISGAPASTPSQMSPERIQQIQAMHNQITAQRNAQMMKQQEQKKSQEKKSAIANSLQQMAQSMYNQPHSVRFEELEPLQQAPVDFEPVDPNQYLNNLTPRNYL